jgi:hypothetical protein
MLVIFVSKFIRTGLICSSGKTGGKNDILSLTKVGSFQRRCNNEQQPFRRRKEPRGKTMEKKYAWKILKKGMKSQFGNCTWKKGCWKKHRGKLRLCDSGFHASKLLPDAMDFLYPGIIALVEYQGEFAEGEDKLVAEEMRVVQTFRFTKKMGVEYAVWCARRCLKNFEKEFPDDKRPRQAINAAARWLKTPTQKNETAARSAAKTAAKTAAESAAGSAAESAARSAAWSAAESDARSTARSAAKTAAESAAWSAAWSAFWSAESDESAAKTAVWSAERKAQHKKLMKIIKHKVKK